MTSDLLLGLFESARVFPTKFPAIHLFYPLLPTSLPPSLPPSLTPQRIPKWVDMNKDGTDKLPESLWKVIMYSITWSWAIYLIATENYFVDLKTHWEGTGIQLN